MSPNQVWKKYAKQSREIYKNQTIDFRYHFDTHTDEY